MACFSWSLVSLKKELHQIQAWATNSYGVKDQLSMYLSDAVKCTFAFTT